MHSLTTASTCPAPSWIIWFWVTGSGGTWVWPEIRKPASTLGATVAGGAGRTSIRQVPGQPSPAAVLPSSHCSPASTEPLPHTGAAGGPGSQFSVQVPVELGSPEPEPLPVPSPAVGSTGA